MGGSRTVTLTIFGEFIEPVLKNIHTSHESNLINFGSVD